MARKYYGKEDPERFEVDLLARFSIERASDEIFWSRPDGRIVYVNEAACRVLGYSREELLSMSIPDINPDVPAERWPERWANLKWSGSLVIESHHRSKEGRVFPVEIAANYMAHAGQEYVVAFVRDISERKQAEGELQESEERYRTIVEDQTEFVIRWLPDGTRTFVNESYCRYRNQPREELVGTSFFRHVVPEDLATLRRAVSALTPQNPVTTYTARATGGDGREHWLQWVQHGLFDPDARLREIQSVGRDITAQKQAEAELARQQEIIRELSTPVLPVGEGLLVLPLIGQIDDQRARQMTDQVLRSIRVNRARVVVIDLTGVVNVDASVANHIIQMAEASRLLGSRLILTGISRKIAEALVQLGVDLRALNIAGDLQRGIEEAYRLLGRVAPPSRVA